MVRATFEMDLWVEVTASTRHEIGIHRWIQEFNGRLPPAGERDLEMRAADTLERIGGVRAVGVRTP